MQKSAAFNLFNQSPVDKSFLRVARTNPDISKVLAPILKEAGKWESLPKGWTQESVKKFWGSLTGEAKHKVTKCMERMKGKIDDTGAFCASLADKVNPGWRSRRADLDDEFGGKAGGIADRVFKTLQAGVRTTAFGDNIEGAVAGFVLAMWTLVASDLKTPAVERELFKVYKTTMATPNVAFVDGLDRFALQVSKLFTGPDARIRAAAFCLALFQKAKMFQVKAKAEVVFRRVLAKDIAQFAPVPAAKKLRPTQVFAEMITPEIKDLAQMAYDSIGNIPQRALELAGSVAEDVNWYSMARNFPESTIDEANTQSWYALVQKVSKALSWGIEDTAAFMVWLLILAGKNSYANTVQREAIKEMPDSYKQASKVAFVSDEQKATDKLVKLVGGDAAAHKLMEIWQSVQGLTKPLYGTALEQLYGAGKVSPVKNFIVKARSDHYSDAAIKHYVEEIQGGKVPTDWKKIKREAGTLTPLSKFIVEALTKFMEEAADSIKKHAGSSGQVKLDSRGGVPTLSYQGKDSAGAPLSLVMVLNLNGGNARLFMSGTSDGESIRNTETHDLDKMVPMYVVGTFLGQYDRDMKTAGAQELLASWGPVLKQASGDNLGELISQAMGQIFKEAAKQIKGLNPKAKIVFQSTTNGMTIKGTDGKNRPLIMDFYMVIEKYLEVKLTWAGRQGHLGSFNGEKSYRTYLFKAETISDIFRNQYESA